MSEEELRDDPSIPDVEPLYHSIHESQHNKLDGTVTSAAFISSSNPDTSVDLSSLCGPEETLARHPGHVGVAQLAAEEVRRVTIGVARDPIEDNPAHALIIRDHTRTPGKWKVAARHMARECTWAIAPTS